MFRTLRIDVRDMLVEQVQFQELLNQLVRRDLIIRYKQSIMGFAWAVFTPLVNTVVFSVVFTRVTAVDVDLPYPLFAFCGLLTWNLTAAALRASVMALTSNANLVTKVYCPREVFVFSAVAVAVIDSLVGAVVLVGMMAYYHIVVTAAILFLPLVLATQILLTTGLGLVLAMANLFYRDVKYIFDVAITVLMFATAVLYSVDQVGGTSGRLLRLNPMSPIIEAYRSVLLRGTLPPLGEFAAAALLSVVVFAGGWLWFHRAETQFAENI